MNLGEIGAKTRPHPMNLSGNGEPVKMKGANGKGSLTTESPSTLFFSLSLSEEVEGGKKEPNFKALSQIPEEQNNNDNDNDNNNNNNNNNKIMTSKLVANRKALHNTGFVA